MSTSTEPNNEDGNNGFGYGQLEHGQLDMGTDRKKFGCGCLTDLNICVSYSGLGRHEIWTKIKDANVRKYINEHRISTAALFVLVLSCFFVLLHLGMQVKNGIKVPNNKGLPSLNCSTDNPCKEGQGICRNDRDCMNDLRCNIANCDEKHYEKLHSMKKVLSPAMLRCCSKPQDTSNLTSSSVFDNDHERFGPQRAVVGTYHTFLGPYFKSKKENFPWFQWKLPRQVIISGVTLVGRECASGAKSGQDDCPLLRNLEIRAGKSSIGSKFSGLITINSLCGNFKGPGEDGGVYTINCDTAIVSDVITIQLKDDNSILQIKSISIQQPSNGISCNGASSCCIPGIPCREGEGDCDVDLDCEQGLLCGHNNCPKKSGFSWDVADDCCYKPSNVKGSAIASSVHKDQRMRYSPTFAIDGKWATRTYNIFTSKTEKMPWLQWKLPNRTRVAGVSISSEYGISKLHDNTTHKNDLVNYEVRAGLSSLPANYKGRILKNVPCGRIEIRGGEDRVYPIVCDQAIIANYITVQIIDDNAVLQINELEVMDGKDESDIGCSCHDFINPNGFGQCKKGSSYEHVKGRNVCYVNRPSNCSDLTYSSTNPGKKFSAEACDNLNESKGNYSYHGEYDCKRQGCWLLSPYNLGKDYGFYSEDDSNCTSCKEECSKDKDCTAVECGGDKDHSTCAWWKYDKCKDETSPNFFTYSKDEYHYGYTCYKGK